jgi:hypothetical protein
VRRALLLGLRRELVLERDPQSEQVDMDAEQPLGRLAAHRVRDGGAHVASLSDVVRVAEPVHELRPRAGDAAVLPAELGRLVGEAVPGQGRQHQVECVLGGAAVSGRVGQRADGVEQLDDRAGPAVGHDQRQRVLVPRPDVDEADVHPVDLRRELRERVQPRLGPAPVVLGLPVPCELPQRRELHALRSIRDQLRGGPARRGDAPAQIDDLLLRNLDLERPNLGRGVDGGAHDPSLSFEHKPARHVHPSPPWKALVCSLVWTRARASAAGVVGGSPGSRAS